VAKQKTDKKIVKQRTAATLAVTALFVMIAGAFLLMMRMNVPNIRVLFSLTLAFLLLLIVYLVLWTLCANNKCSRVATIISRCYLVFISLGVAFFFTMLGLIISNAHTEEADVDCIIVLGAGLRNDAPSLILRYRLNAAMTYMQEREGTPVILAGGLGQGETITEAEAMFRYLISRGVEESLLLKEEASTRTQENIEFSLDLLSEMGFDREHITIAVVTNEFHVFRSKLIAEKAGVKAVGVAAPTPGLYLRVVYFSREAFALAAELMFGEKSVNSE